MSKEITNFVNEELIPLLFGCVDRVFPEMDFKQRGNLWGSPFKLNGERRSRWEKSYISSRNPKWIAEQGGDRVGVIDYYMEKHSLTFPEAVKELCSIVGLELPPMGDAESYKLYKEKQDRLEKVASQMEAALYTDEGAATLRYLKEERGYSDEFIKFANFGYISEAVLPELQDLFKWMGADGRERTLPFGVGNIYTLSIPYRTGNEVKGFIFRTILPEEQLHYTTRDGEERKHPKYKDAFISGAASNRYNLFGLTGLRLTGTRERDRDIVMVEGQIDALRASFNGVDNVVAASGGDLYKEALQEAKRRGVKRVVLLFDTEEKEDSQQLNYKRAERAISIIKEEGLKPYICYLPSDGGKVDVDSYLQNHTGEELKKIIYDAISGDMWLYYRLKNKFAEEQPEEGYIQDGRQVDDFANNTLALCNSPFVSDLDRTKIISDFAATTKIDLTEAADKLKEVQLKSKQRAETISLASEALTLATSGDVEGAIAKILQQAPELSQISKEAEYSSLLANPTEAELRDRFKERPTGIVTNYSFENRKGEEEPLVLPVGALTYICAPTSHGKSRMLENLALQLSQNGEEGDVLYFSFEEDSTAVQEQLLNIYANMHLSKNNLRSLRSYYQSGNGYFVEHFDLERFKEKEREFFYLLTSGKLKIFYKDYGSSELIEAIKYYSKQRKIKAVFVDYIQLLHTRGTRLQRREELGEMCKNLWRLATEASIPIVLAAQLNREAYSPLDMTSQNIAEAADIERSANTIILLWNSDFYPTPQKSSYYTKNRELTDEAKRLEDRGFKMGTSGQIYAKMTKNRGGTPNLDAILNFDGNKGKIEENYSKPQPKQAEIAYNKEEDNSFSY